MHGRDGGLCKRGEKTDILRNIGVKRGFNKAVSEKQLSNTHDDAVEKSLKELNDRISVEIIVRFKKDKETLFVCLDDAECIALDKDVESQKLITDNYGLLKKLATSVEYQYLLNMNYTRIIFAKK